MTHPGWRQGAQVAMMKSELGRIRQQLAASEGKVEEAQMRLQARPCSHGVHALSIQGLCSKSTLFTEPYEVAAHWDWKGLQQSHSVGNSAKGLRLSSP